MKMIAMRFSYPIATIDHSNKQTRVFYVQSDESSLIRHWRYFRVTYSVKYSQKDLI